MSIATEMHELLDEGYGRGASASMDLPGGAGAEMAKQEFMTSAKSFNSALQGRTDKMKVRRLKMLLGTLGVLMKGIDGAEMASVHVRKALKALTP
jgi:hypothetical protein